VTRYNILHGLRTGRQTRHMNARQGIPKRLTLRRTPMPVKIVLAGENG
jgi:hypothetical protein